MSARAPIRLYLSPTTLGVVLDRGTPREDLTSVSAVLLRLRTQRGSCALLPALGSRLAKLVKIDANAKRLAVDYIAEALADLVERGEVRKLASEVKMTANGRIAFVVTFVDRAGQTRAIQHTHQAGA